MADLQPYLLGTQIFAIVTYIGMAFGLYKLYVDVFKARIDGLKEENERLKSQIMTPSEALNQIALAKEAMQAEIKLVKFEKEKTETEFKLLKESDEVEKRTDQQRTSEMDLRIKNLTKKLNEYENKGSALQELLSSIEQRKKSSEATSAFQLFVSDPSFSTFSARSMQTELLNTKVCNGCGETGVFSALAKKMCSICKRVFCEKCWPMFPLRANCPKC